MTIVTISALTAATTDVMIDVARTTTTTTTTTARSALHHHRQKGATPMVRSKPPTDVIGADVPGGRPCLPYIRRRTRSMNRSPRWLQ
jgi:hypothetical protein